MTIEVRSTNLFIVPEQGLGIAEVRPQDNAETALRRSLDAWRSLGGLSLRFLLSPGGLGKSFIVGRLRKQWQENGLHEVMLDGETVLDDVRLIERTFSSLYPFPKSPFDDGAKPALVRWLKRQGKPEPTEGLAERVFYHLLTLACALTANMFFRAASLHEGLVITRGMWGFNGLAPNPDLAKLIDPAFLALLFGAALVVALLPNTQQIMSNYRPAVNWRLWRTVGWPPIVWRWRVRIFSPHRPAAWPRCAARTCR